MWQRLGAPEDFVGSTLWVNGEACTVIGITRAEFTGGTILVAPELWLPLGMFARVGPAASRAGGLVDLTQPGVHSLALIGRLPAGESIESIGPRLPALSQLLTDLQPAGTEGSRQVLVTPPSRLVISTSPDAEDDLPFLAVPLVFMAACVLLIASLNLANMLLARGAARAREIAVRLALGASRARIIQQLLVEGLILALAGGAAGLFISDWANNAMVASLAGALEGVTNVTLVLRPRLDLTVLGFTFLASVVATVLFSLAPALRASRRNVVTDLRAAGARTATGGNWNRFFAGRNLLVMAQISLSLVLLFSASLFLRGAVKAGDIPLGFEPDGRIVTEMDFSLRNTTPDDAQRSLAGVLERISAYPGIASAALSTTAPMNNRELTRRVQPAGTPADAPPGPQALFAGVSPGHFATLGVPVLRGRDFTDLESRDAAAPGVAILDESLARRLFPEGNAIGRRVSVSGAVAGAPEQVLEVVGIVGEHRHEFLQVEPTLRVFVPLVRGYVGQVYLETRLADTARAGLAAAAASLRGELQRINPDLPVLRHEPLDSFIGRDASLWSAKLGAVVFGLFGAIALLLSVMGVYAVKSYSVAGRTREIGIRCALGARPSDILGLVMTQGAAQTAVACSAGTILALLAGKGLTSLLFHISPADPVSLIAAMCVLVISALGASYIPARRAIQIEPTEALRTE